MYVVFLEKNIVRKCFRSPFLYSFTKNKIILCAGWICALNYHLPTALFISNEQFTLGKLITTPW